MAIFEKPGYWGLKDPLEVRVQHETCIYMGDNFSSHFEPKKIDQVGRRGQKQPKLGIFEGTNIGQFWSNRPFWLKQIYRDIKFILRGLPGRCDLPLPRSISFLLSFTTFVVFARKYPLFSECQITSCGWR